MIRFSGMNLIKKILFVLLCASSFASFAQVTGGQFAFEFLRMSNSPHISALGGISVADPENDIAFAQQNPAMMRPGLHNLLDLDYNNYYAGIKVMNMQYGYYVPQLNSSFFMGVQYLNYGSMDVTDNSGNIFASMNPSDYSINFGAARSYGDHWRYGADIKYAHSYLFMGTASALLTDVGINYYDTMSNLDFGAVAKNMGFLVTEYTTANHEPVPFDLQLGVSKGLKHVPLKLFVTIHHLYEWDIRYSNQNELSANNVLGIADTNAKQSSYFGDNLFRHFIFGAELSLAKKITITASYNYLHRKELALSTVPGLAGFAFGIGLHLNTWEIHYARTYYHIAGAYNEIGIALALNKMFGIGNIGEKIGWNKTYNDWE